VGGDRFRIDKVRSNKGSLTAFAFAAATLTFLFYVPLASFILGIGSSPITANASAGSLFMVFTDPYYRHILVFTLTQAALSTAAAVVLGLPGAYMLSRFDFAGKRLLAALSAIPFMLPPILVVLGFILFFGTNGLANTALMRIFGLKNPPLSVLYSLKGIVLAHAFYNFPVVARIVSAAWERVPGEYAEAARTLGASPAAVFRDVTLPALLPSLLSSACLVFLFCMLSFPVVLVLGGGPKVATIEVEIYRSARITLDTNATPPSAPTVPSAGVGPPRAMTAGR
jgi:thiamine transport system permease protein